MVGTKTRDLVTRDPCTGGCRTTLYSPRPPYAMSEANASSEIFLHWQPGDCRRGSRPRLYLPFRPVFRREDNQSKPAAQTTTFCCCQPLRDIMSDASLGHRLRRCGETELSRHPRSAGIVDGMGCVEKDEPTWSGLNLPTRIAAWKPRNL